MEMVFLSQTFHKRLLSFKLVCVEQLWLRLAAVILNKCFWLVAFYCSTWELLISEQAKASEINVMYLSVSDSRRAAVIPVCGCLSFKGKVYNSN